MEICPFENKECEEYKPPVCRLTGINIKIAIKCNQMYCGKSCDRTIQYNKKSIHDEYMPKNKYDGQDVY